MQARRRFASVPCVEARTEAGAQPQLQRSEEAWPAADVAHWLVYKFELAEAVVSQNLRTVPLNGEEVV